MSRAVLTDVSNVVATGAEIADSTIKAVSDEVDRQTDELQEPKKD